MRISASFHHVSRRDKLSSDTARETIKKVRPSATTVTTRQEQPNQPSSLNDLDHLQICRTPAPGTVAPARGLRAPGTAHGRAPLPVGRFQVSGVQLQKGSTRRHPDRLGPDVRHCRRTGSRGRTAGAEMALRVYEGLKRTQDGGMDVAGPLG
jgi:hypothetical protein